MILCSFICIHLYWIESWTDNKNEHPETQFIAEVTKPTSTYYSVPKNIVVLAFFFVDALINT